MTKSEIEKQRHFKSLEAAAAIAEKAELIAMEKGWEYEKAATYVRKREPELAELEFHGYIRDTDEPPHLYTRKEADKILTEKVLQRQKETGEPYHVAQPKVFSDPKNSELLRCYD
jgi:hypothetical protein